MSIRTSYSVRQLYAQKLEVTTMKTRAQIYSHETSGILWDIFTYGVLHKNRFWVYIHRRMSNALCAMNTMDLQRYPENYELLSTDAALRAEQIACRMRHLVYGFTTVQKHEDLTSAANVLGITITAHPGLVEITLPGLLPACRVGRAFLCGRLSRAVHLFRSLQNVHVLRHDKGRDNVEQNACASQAEGRPDQANDGGIDAEVLGKTLRRHRSIIRLLLLYSFFIRSSSVSLI